MSDDDLLKDAKEAFELVSEVEEENRRAYLDDIKFGRLGEQWPEDVRRAREAEGRPCLTFNVLPPITRQVVNDGRQNKPAISVQASDDQADPETAQVLAGLIRNIEYSSRAQGAYDTGLDCAASGGIGYWRIDIAFTRDDSFEKDLIIKRVANPLSIYGDPYSEEFDSSDWDTAFEVTMLDPKRFGRVYKDRLPTDWATGYGDRLHHQWRDGDRIQVARWWRREAIKRNLLLLSDDSAAFEDDYETGLSEGLFQGLTVEGRPRPVDAHKVTHTLLSGVDVLEQPEVWAGRFIPIIPVYGEEVNLEGKRYLRSVIRDAKDPQQDLNYWSTTATELTALAPKAPWLVASGSIPEGEEDKWATANTETHAYLEYDASRGPPPQRQPFAGVPAGAMQQALNASDMIKRVTGIHDASLGIRSNETSGVAIKARQREGDTSTFHYQDNLNRSISHTGVVLIDLIPKVFSQKRVARTLGIEGPKSAKKVVVGTEADAAALAQAKIAVEAGYADAKQAELAKLDRIYVLGVGKYDVAVEAGPSFTTRREEAATQMIELIRAFPQAAPVIGDLLAENLDWPGADKVSERLKALLPPQLQEGGEQELPPQVQEQMAQGVQMIQQQQGQLQQMQAALQQATNDRQLKEAELQIKARELDIKEIEAQAKLIDAQTKARAPIFPGGLPQGALAA